MNTRIANKILALVSFSLIFFALLIIIYMSLASEYEFSIYAAFPKLFWFLLLFSVIMAQMILIINSFGITKHNSWIFGLIAIIISNQILLFLPFSRGYFSYGRGDTLSHIGYIQDILTSGNFFSGPEFDISNNMYPILHILSSEMVMISSVSATKLSMIIPGLFSNMFALFMYVLFFSFSKYKIDTLFILVLSSALFLGPVHILLIPNYQSFLFLPFIIYSYYKALENPRNENFRIISVILSIVTVFFHPLTCICGIIILLILNLSCLVNRKQVGVPFYSFISYKLIAITSIAFFIWSSYAYILLHSIIGILNWVNGEVSTSEFQSKMHIVAEANLSPSLLINYIITLYGAWILLTILGFVSLLYVILQFKKNHQLRGSIYIFSSMGFVLFLLISLIIFFVNFNYGFGRFFLEAIIFIIMLSACSMNHMVKSNNSLNHRKLLTLLFCIFIILFTYTSIFNLFPSNSIRLENAQVTAQEFVGMETFYNNRYEDIPIIEFGISQKRFSDAIFGAKSHQENIVSYGKKATPIDHFGYDLHDSIDNMYTNSYLIITSFGRRYYNEIFPEFKDKWKFNTNDFNKLEIDKKIEKIYFNEGFAVYLIQ